MQIANDNGTFYGDDLREVIVRLYLARKWRIAAGEHPAAADALERAANRQVEAATAILWNEAGAAALKRPPPHAVVGQGGRDDSVLDLVAQDTAPVMRRLGLAG